MSTVNKGKAPFDPDSPVGRFRQLANATEWEPLDPVESGYGNYKDASDAEIEAYLDAARGNMNRAVGTYLLAMAAAAAAEARLIQDFDLKLSTISRAGDLRRVGQAFLDQAVADDTADGLGDIFEAFTLGGNSQSIPEGSLPQVGRSYTWGRL